jgi:hypothetical protein
MIFTQQRTGPLVYRATGISCLPPYESLYGQDTNILLSNYFAAFPSLLTSPFIHLLLLFLLLHSLNYYCVQCIFLLQN